MPSSTCYPIFFTTVGLSVRFLMSTEKAALAGEWKFLIEVVMTMLGVEFSRLKHT